MKFASFLVALLAVPGFVQAKDDLRALARETSDPTSNLWYLFTEFTYTASPAAHTESFTIELQPTLPVQISEGWRVMNYPDLEFVTQGGPDASRVTGLASFSWLAALGPEARSGLAWGAGPALGMPVATDSRLGPTNWQAGLGGVLAYKQPGFVASVLTKALWDTDGPPGGSVETIYNLQFFVGNGWQVGLGRPRITLTWDDTGKGEWDLPVGVDVGRVVRLGTLPVKFVLEYEFFVVNDSRWEPEHLVRFMIVPVLRNPFARPSND